MQFDIRRLDIYRKVPKDLTQPTYTGAFISIVACLFLAYLFVAEFYLFLKPQVLSDLYVADPSLSLNRIDVHLDISLPRMKCIYIGLDIQDESGRHEVGFVENTVRQPLGEEGCRMTASFKINRLPGNFHLSSHSSEEQPDNPDTSHVINSLYFGNASSYSLHEEKLTNTFTSLKNLSHLDSDPLSTHEYLLKIVPSHIEDGYGDLIHQAYQYTYAHRQMVISHGHHMSPVILFRHDLNPISVRYVYTSKPIYTFLTTVCAIIGGTFTVAGIIDSLLFSASEVVKKFQMGKLS